MQPRTVSRIDCGTTSLRHTIQRGGARNEAEARAAQPFISTLAAAAVLCYRPDLDAPGLPDCAARACRAERPDYHIGGALPSAEGALRRRTRCAGCRSTSARGKRLPTCGGQGARRAATLEVLTAAARARSRRSWQNKRGGCSPENRLLTCTSCKYRLLPAQLDTCRGSKGLRAAMQNKYALIQIGVAEAMQQAQFGRRSRPSAPEYYLSLIKKKK